MGSSKKNKFLVFAFLGRPGSGKGTQAKLLSQKYPLRHISTGSLLRDRTKRRDFVGRRLKEIMEMGGLVPTPCVFQLWMRELEKLFHQKKYRGVILDGSPRKLYEAKMLDEVLGLFDWSENMRVLNVKVSDKEAMKRLLKRGRSDDDKKDILYRLRVFDEEAAPTIRYYREKNLVIDINGEQSVEDVHREILMKLKRFLK